MRTLVTVFTISLVICCGSLKDKSTNSEQTEEIEDSSPAQIETSRQFVTIRGIAVHISDGDTLIVEDETGFKTIIRLAGIDAPESDQPFGNESSDTLSGLVEGKPVSVESKKIDRYGRTVGKITLNGKDICLEMVRRGFAWHFKLYEDEQPDWERKQYSDAEIIARNRRIGLWKDAYPKEPWVFREEQRARELQPTANSNVDQTTELQSEMVP